MVDFSVGFDTQKKDDKCKELVEEIPATLLQLIEGMRSGGREHVVAVASTGDGHYPTEVLAGSETEITGEIIQELWLKAIQEPPTYNANFDDTYVIHTHPSGLAGMSFYDVTSSIKGLQRASPITGNFVATEHRGRVKINGLTLKETIDRGLMVESEEVEEAFSRAKSLESMVEKGTITNGQAKSDLLVGVEKIFDTCSYMVSLADLENRARQNG